MCFALNVPPARAQREGSSSAPEEKARIVTVVLPSATGAVSVSARAAEPIARRDASMTPRFVTVAALLRSGRWLRRDGRVLHRRIQSRKGRRSRVAGQSPRVCMQRRHGDAGVPGARPDRRQRAASGYRMWRRPCSWAQVRSCGPAPLSSWMSWPKSSEAAPGHDGVDRAYGARSHGTVRRFFRMIRSVVVLVSLGTVATHA